MMGDMGWHEHSFGGMWGARVDGEEPPREMEMVQKPVEIGERAPESEVINYEPNGNVIESPINLHHESYPLSDAVADGPSEVNRVVSIPEPPERMPDDVPQPLYYSEIEPPQPGGESFLSQSDSQLDELPDYQ